jgi:hypothetical protein
LSWQSLLDTDYMQIEQCQVFPRRNEVVDTISVVRQTEETLEEVMEEEIILLVEEVEVVIKDGEVTIEEQILILDTEVAVVMVDQIIIVTKVEEVDTQINDIRIINTGGMPTKT